MQDFASEVKVLHTTLPMTKSRLREFLHLRARLLPPISIVIEIGIGIAILIATAAVAADCFLVDCAGSDRAHGSTLEPVHIATVLWSMVEWWTDAKNWLGADN